MPLFEHVHLAERFDTRGHVEARARRARRPGDWPKLICSKYKIPLFCVARLRQSRFLNRLAVQP